jgi:DDE superfamily endonuclease
MHQLIPTLAHLVEAFRPCFRAEVFATFQAVVAAWALCPSPHTLAEVWQATGWAAKRHHDLIYALFRAAVWDWDEVGILLASLILIHLVPGGLVWVAVDDTLCHKRGAKVAFGGIFLDPVLSSRRRKVLRFGLNWVVLGIAVRLPCRPDRYFCLPVLWRLFRKQGQPGHRKRTDLAAEMTRTLAQACPDRQFWLVGDGAYINKVVLRDRPANLQVIGPLPWRAALYAPAPPRQKGQRGATRKKGERLPTPQEMVAATARYPAEERVMAFPAVTRRLRLQVVRDVLWYAALRDQKVLVVLVRDLDGHWRDEALLCTDPTQSAAFVVQGYCRRWSIEVAFHDSKQYLGLDEPRVWCERSVARAHPMAWLVQSLTVLWYAVSGAQGEQLKRQRPWYRDKRGPSFTDMLGCLRLQLWREHVYGPSGDQQPTPEMLENLLTWLAAVR